MHEMKQSIDMPAANAERCNRSIGGLYRMHQRRDRHEQVVVRVTERPQSSTREGTVFHRNKLNPTVKDKVSDRLKLFQLGCPRSRF